MSKPLAEAPDLRRRALLREMGVDVWVRRGSSHPAIAPGPSGMPEQPRTMSAAVQPAGGVPDPAVPLSPGWDALRTEVAACTRCPLHRGRTQTVFGAGALSPRWLIIGEAPGAEEDRQGEPFVGPAGKLLNEMLRAVGVDRGQVFIANIVKCRPPDNRDPRPDEVAACADHLNRQMEFLSPRLILAVGRIAAQTLLVQDVPVGRLRGRVHAWGPRGIPLVVTYHPAYLLRSPGEKAKAWSDLRLARNTEDPSAA